MTLSNRPAFIGQSSNVTDALAGGLGSAQPPRISTSDDRFQPLDENGTATMPAQLELDVVIVGANPNKSRVYYEGNYDPQDPAPPDCWSDNGVGPSEHAIKPQNITCSSCPRAAWTKINANGKAVPWCQERKKAAVLVIGGGPMIYLLSVPPKSHKSSLQPYIDSVRRQGADVSDVVTTVGIKDKVWTFKEKSWLPNEKTYNYVQEVKGGDMPANVVNLFDKPWKGALPAPKVDMPALEKQVAGEIPVVRHGPLLPEFHPEMRQEAKFQTPPMKMLNPEISVATETLSKLDSLFAKFGPK